MIYYFSGTGNSREVAQRIGQLLGCKVSEINSTDETPDLSPTEDLGLVFPVYAWGLPRPVEQFIGRLASVCSSPFVWAVMTCGDDMGYADRVLDNCLYRSLKKRADAVYSVAMPNTYVCLPGFDVDAPDVASGKVCRTAERLPEIAHNIRERIHCHNVVRGAFPWMKTYLLRPFFNRFLIGDRPFRTDEKRCTRCGLCQKLCPTQNIRLSSAGIRWGQTECVGCLRCYHSCPTRAIDWGRQTLRKGQQRMDGKIWQCAVSQQSADCKNCQ